MSKEKSKLQIAADNIALLVNQTNTKINELGIQANSLNAVLSIIQKQFDKIRNVPSDTKREYENAKKVRLEWKCQVDKIESDYDSATKVNLNAGAAGAGLGVGVVALGPTAAMSIATTFGVASTGTAISTLSGAAATNAALAWLGGGTLAAGGGGMAGGSALIALSGPVGWTIAGVAIASSSVMFLIAKSEKNRLENVFLNVSKRDEKKYKLAIIELNERISRIKGETEKISSAIVEIGMFGTDYETMTEQQQYTLGAYVNFMSASAQLLVDPIMGLQPNYSEKDLESFFFSNSVNPEYRSEKGKKMIIYFANLLYKIETEEQDLKLLAKSFRGDKKFLKQMNLEKEDISLELLNLVGKALRYKKSRMKLFSQSKFE